MWRGHADPLTWAWALLGALVWLALVLVLRRNRIWLFYYLVAAVGFCFGLVVLLRNLLPGEAALAMATAYGTHYLAGLLDIPTRVFRSAPGLLLVLVIAQRSGWTALQVGLESSGLLEMSVLTGLLAFYPGIPLPRRVASLAVGLVATYVANVLRVLIIVAVLHFQGKDSLLFAHTFLGRAFFFAVTVAIYWYLMTRSSLQVLRERVLHSLGEEAA
ncbi:MAG: archaeosortase/exosortase family protein [Anaerolineae bacterium]|nr:archaeosortase/exosortase family protein [Anaerolineae bacterium]